MSYKTSELNETSGPSEAVKTCEVRKRVKKQNRNGQWQNET